MPVIIILFFIWSVSRYVQFDCLYVSLTSGWWTYFTYNFVHISFLHWLSNSIVFYIYYRVLSRKDYYVLFPLCTAIPALAAFLAVQNTPTCGFSSVIYIITGYYIVIYGKRILKPLILITFSFAFTALFAHGINTLIHVYSFGFSFLLSMLYKEIYYARHRNCKN